MRWIIFGVIILFLILISVYRITRKRQPQVTNHKVIQLSAHSKKREQARKQKCSFCRKENKKLTFYSDENGKIVGVCAVCKPLAERRALMRL